MALGLIVALPLALAQERIEPALEEGPMAPPASAERPPFNAGPEPPERPERSGPPVGSPAPERSSQGQRQDNQAESQQPVTPPIATIRDSDEVKSSDGRSSESERREKEDLIAQQTMAEAALQMLKLTKRQIGLGVIGAALLIAALIYTARQTRAATEANKLTRDALIASHRAWMKVTAIKIVSPLTWTKGEGGDPDVGRITIDFVLRNVGESPAFNVWMDASITAGFFAPDAGHIRYHKMAQEGLARPVPPHWGNTIFPNDMITQQHILQVSKETWTVKTGTRIAQSPVTTLLLVGCATYGLLVEKERRQTGFAFPIQDRDSNRRLRPLGPERGEIPAENLKVIRGFSNDTFAD
jgi:hypothetical protein